jgi:hypothetical protein
VGIPVSIYHSIRGPAIVVSAEDSERFLTS